MAMSAQDIHKTLKALARSQGSYGRLLRFWDDAGVTGDALDTLAALGLNDPVDLILALEG